jgi:exopolysaccharide biosynthesis WecB/TagA/CpsF family protein
VRVLIVSQYFWPENFRINDVVEHFKSRGHEVEILTGYPNYPEGKIFDLFKKNPNNFNEYKGAKIFRIPVRLRKKSTKIDLFLNYLTFVLSSILFGTIKLRKKNYDVVFTFATSPITVAITSIYFSKIKNAKHVLWVLDLWPDILEELKIVKNKLVLYLLNSTVKFIYKKTDLILAQSHSFKKIISDNYKIRSIEYLPAWSEDINSKNSTEIKNSIDFTEKKLNICFTGNIGEAQNFENIMEAAKILKDQKDIEWTVVGTGRNIDKIKKFKNDHNINNFNFLGSKPLSDIGYYHSIADILLVSLKPGKALSSTIPGKVQTYLNSNKFILGFIEGEAKKIIEDSQAGRVIDPNLPLKLAEEITYLKNNRSIIQKVTNEKNGTRYLDKKFNKKIIFNNLNDYLEKAFSEIEKIKLIKNPLSVPWNKNFTLSGLNLAFLGYYTKGSIKLNSDLYNWSDGIFFNRFFSRLTKKFAGRDLILQIQVPGKIKKIYVFGSLTKVSQNYLQKRFNKEIIHINLPYDSAENLYKNYCKIKFDENDFIILTLPTPKQEQFAELIRKNNNYFKVVCVGGAIVMASGEERRIPNFLEKAGLEFLWRLRTDTTRRLKRLIVTFVYYIYGELSFRFSGLKKEFIQNNEE